MTTKLSVLNWSAIQSATVKNDPYPYFVVEQALTLQSMKPVSMDFPAIGDGGSYSLSALTYGPSFRQLVADFDSPQLRRVIEEKFAVDLHNRPMVATARGYSRAKDGRIHTDSKSKLITVLVYLNEQWSAEAGRLRILRSKNNMDDYVSEVTPTVGRMIAFKVTPNCWHGYPSFEGVRRSLQVNFVTNEAAVAKHGKRHGLTAKLKAFKHQLFG